MAIAPSLADILAAGIGEAQAARPDMPFLDGDVTTAILHGAAAMADTSIEYSTQLAKAVRVTTASKSDLDEAVADIKMTRKPATKATVILTFTRTSGGAAGTIPANTTVATEPQADGRRISFKTTTAIVVGAGNNGPFVIAAGAIDFGPEGNVSAGSITRISDTLFDTFNVTNAASAAGGNFAESDDSLRARYFDFFGSLEQGTEKALRLAALSVLSIRYVGFRESGGVVDIVVSDQTGASNLLMIAEATAAINLARVLGPTLNIVGSTPYVIDLTLGILADPGFNFDAAAPGLEILVENTINALVPGEEITLHSLISLIISRYPANLSRVDFEQIVGNGVFIFPTTTIALPDPFRKLRAGTIQVHRVDA